jgi:hypothetical protein
MRRAKAKVAKEARSSEDNERTAEHPASSCSRRDACVPSFLAPPCVSAQLAARHIADWQHAVCDVAVHLSNRQAFVVLAEQDGCACHVLPVRR